ncbi:hypothetical protein BBO99_00004194 [Phytophthora kernoviae]|uniref:Peptidyl-prolyl cis-trans isomerase n=1 Tax=Phytophthora kernoviae TaxID=325452 RepID=A0A421GS41_9STRA|nr:hypothetical protein BBI17_004040 [Phytophthora kernoviae]RLN80853.1 hypothetical protein BBO99_00004194 [Phytophthora kernoviae]
MDFLRATMAPDVRDGDLCGVEELLQNWKLLSLYFGSVHVHLEHLKSIAIDSLQATTTTSVTITKSTLRYVFPHLNSDGNGGVHGGQWSPLAARLVDQRVVMRGSVFFGWDAAAERVATPPTHVVFETSVGDFTVELYSEHAPKTCWNIAELARRGYYNNTIFHRIIKDFMIQGGDPTGTGRGGESIYGAKFDDEITKELKHTGAGVLSMANSGPNTNGSQFFITLAPTPWLDGIVGDILLLVVDCGEVDKVLLGIVGKHTVFGRISAGMKVIQRMGMVPTGANDR